MFRFQIRAQGTSSNFDSYAPPKQQKKSTNIASEYTKIASENSCGFIGPMVGCLSTFEIPTQKGVRFVSCTRGGGGSSFTGEIAGPRSGSTMSGQLTIGWRTGLLDVGLEGPWIWGVRKSINIVNIV